MGVIRTIAIVMGLFSITSASAAEAGKLTICPDRLVVVPSNPRFVMSASELVECRQRDGCAQLLPERSIDQPLDETYVSVIVPMQLGEEHRLPLTPCGTRYKVSDEWQPPTSPFALTGAELQLAEGESIAYLDLAWEAPSLGWTRIDWSDLKRDLDNGVYSSTLSSYSDVPIEVMPDFEVIHVRLVQYLPDGSARTWRGRVLRDGERLRIAPEVVDASSVVSIERGIASSCLLFGLSCLVLAFALRVPSIKTSLASSLG